MKIVRFLGGLGNQMFQYTFYIALKKNFPDVQADLSWFKDYNSHNGYELENIFGIKVSEISSFKSSLYDIHNRKWVFRKLRRILHLKKAYQEEIKMFSYDPSVLSNKDSAYHWGYWQNIRYFKSVENEIKRDFTFKKPLNTQNQDTLSKIRNSNSISIHIRRGDYINDPLLGGLCDLAYYKSAINHVESYVNSPKYFIFSNDISWCRENLDISDAEFIDWNTGALSYIDMQLMAECKHNIIANSSFSWWGAWLNSNSQKIVISPKKWVNDPMLDTTGLIPDTWLSI